MIGINMTMNDVIAYCINYDRAVHDSELIRTVLFYSLVSDIFEVAHDALQVGNVPKLKEVMDYLYDILKGNTYNIYHIRRHFLELSLQVSEIDNYTNLLLNNYANRNQFNDMDGYFKRDLNDNTKCAGIISDALSKIEKSCAGVSFKFVINNEIELTNMIIRGTSRELGIIDSTSRTVKHMQDIKKLMESEIDIINMKSLMKTSYSPKNVYFNTYAATDIKEGGNTVTDVLCFLDGTIREKNIQRYIPYCTLSLENNDINHFIKSRKINMIGLLDDEYGQRVYAGVSADRVYILAKSTHGKHTTYYLCRVYDVKDAEPLGAPSILDNLTASDENFIKEIKMPIIKLNYTGKIYASENRESVTEGITFDKNGDIKFIFNPRKSLMDEYAENHKLLKANSDNGNIQGMKDNLAFLFALITKIEREYLFKDSKKSEAEKKDAAKARAFAINDFKTYIKQVYKAEPTFNFNDYYESSNYGKYVVRVTNDDIKGAKLLFRTIMMS